MISMGDSAQWSYLHVLRNGRVRAMMAGKVVSNVGDGVIITGTPLLALRIHGGVSPALAIGAVETAPYVLATALAFAIGFGRLRFPPRMVIIADCVLRGGAFLVLGVLTMTNAITLPVLIVGLLVGSMLRMIAMSAYRIAMTSMVRPEDRFALNGLLGTASSLALFAIGPVLGGVLAAAANPGIVLLVDGISFVALLAATVCVAPASANPVSGQRIPESGLQIMRRVPIAGRLFLVVFCFNLFYMPVDVALPLLVRDQLGGSGTGLGVIWGGFGLGAVLGALATSLLGRLPQQKLAVAIIGGWGGATLLLFAAPTVPFAVGAFLLGGLIYAPFTPVVYTLVQSVLDPDEQQPVITLWSAGSVLASPVGLAVAGPLVQAVGPRGALLTSALLTIALVPLAGAGMRQRIVRPTQGTSADPISTT